MSVVSDIATLYETVHSTWAKVRADVVAHTIFLLVVFEFCGATFPHINLPAVTANQITTNEWFKLAKETGLLYFLILVPVAAVFAYGVILRTAGQVLSTLLAFVFQPQNDWQRSKLLTPYSLEPLAILSGKEDFEMWDLRATYDIFALRFRTKGSDTWQSYQRSLAKRGSDAAIYLGDFGFLLAAWLGLFLFLPDADWTRSNHAQHWPVALTLAGLVAFSWLRVTGTLRTMPALQMFALSTMIRADPEMSSVLQIPEDRRARIAARLDELLAKARDANQGPSFIKLAGASLGFRSQGRHVYGRPFPILYRRGETLAEAQSNDDTLSPGWVGDYGAFLYYRFHRRVTIAGRLVWHWLFSRLTGER